MNRPYMDLLSMMREIATLSSVSEVLGWDQETMMPAKAARFRAEELALLSSMVHKQIIDPRMGALLEACESDPELAEDPRATANLRELRRDYERACKLPNELVAELSETSSLAMDAWKRAREDSDFEAFRPWLEKQVRLARRKAECFGAPEGGELYDTLIADYEPGMTGPALERLFAPLRDGLVPLIDALTSSGNEPDQALARVELPIEQQDAFNRHVLTQLGFDFEAGRLDVSAHPFSAGIAPSDTRITTRYRKDGFLDALGSTMHEAGHALYEQGLPKAEFYGQPLAEPVSLGIHESQSRTWENQVGRSRAFWAWAWPQARRFFGNALPDMDTDSVYRTVNTVRPHLIRVESDEATYNLHIMLRFDLERAMIRDELRPRDLPDAWNTRIQDDLGLEVPDDRRGCLQDVHWSMGSFGYFPTYTLGNLYAAQLWESAAEALGDLDEQFARGEFSGLLVWLRRQIHAHGRRYPAPELCRSISGRQLEHEPLLRYLESKLRAVYGLGQGR